MDDPQSCKTFNELKKTLRENLRYLQDTGAKVAGSGAHVVEAQQEQEASEPHGCTGGCSLTTLQCTANVAKFVQRRKAAAR